VTVPRFRRPPMAGYKPTLLSAGFARTEEGGLIARHGWACGALLAAALLLTACTQPADDVSTFTVEPITFARRITAEGTLKPVKATPVGVPQNATSPMKVAWIAEDGSLLRKGDVIVRFSGAEFENLLLNGREDRSTATNKLEKSSAQASSTRKNLGRDARMAQSELEAARRFTFDDAEVFSRYARIESEVDQDLAASRKRHAEEVLGVRENLARVDRDLLAIEDRRAGMKIKQAEEGLQALQVIAPHDGILVLQRNWRGDMTRVGDTMWMGQPIGEIPELSSMQAEVFVLEADAAGLAVDQKATLFLEADSAVPFTGKVKAVDKVARPRIPRQPVQYFGVTVELQKTNPKLMKPGARVRAVLEVENQTNAFAIPRQALFDKEGKKLVYRRKGDKFEPVEVTIGSSSAGRVVVTKGLARGDVIALEEPKKQS
jgi:HlyD family secretion protein